MTIDLSPKKTKRKHYKFFYKKIKFYCQKRNADMKMRAYIIYRPEYKYTHTTSLRAKSFFART